MAVSDTSDLVEVHNLLARLARATDIGTLSEYLDNFTDDAVLQIAGQPPREGREALGDAAEAGRNAGRIGPGTQTAHHLTTIEVQIDGERALSEASFLFLAETASQPVIRSAGRYHDVFRKTPAGWRLASRMIEPG